MRLAQGHKLVVRLNPPADRPVEALTQCSTAVSPSGWRKGALVFNRLFQLKGLHLVCIGLTGASVFACGDGLGDATAAPDDIDRAAAAGPNTTNTFMPERASVSTAERRKLGEWQACGAP